MRASRIGLVGLLAALPLSACFCPDEPPLTDLRPQAELVDPSDVTVSPCAVDKIRECDHDFGSIATGRGEFWTVRLHNPGRAPLAVADIHLEGDPAFTLVTTPPPNDEGNVEVEEVKEEGYTPADIVLAFSPLLASEVRATLFITTDAGNLDPGEIIEVELVGTGVDAGGPKIVVEPPTCDFGEVGVWQVAYCDLTLKNEGQRDLELNGFTFSAATPLSMDAGGNFDVSVGGFGSQTLVLLPTYVAPGTGTTIRLFAVPTEVGPMTGELTISSNDAITGPVAVPLLVMGADVPTAVAEVKSVNGTLVTGAVPPIQPLDDVVLTGERSVDANGDEAGIVAWHWEIVPDGDPLGGTDPDSAAFLTTPDSATTGFAFDSAAGTVAGVDVAGTYVVRLTVTDVGGRVSSNEARVTLNAIPQEALHIQLTWDSPNYDYDLHLVKDGGPWCSADASCYYGNCDASGFFGLPEWDGVSGDTAGDPSLDIDDLDGYGPENINIDVPIDANYRIGVHAYSATVSEEVWATVKVFINGALAFEDSRAMPTGRDFWEVAEVQWHLGAATVFSVGAYQNGWSCPGGLFP